MSRITQEGTIIKKYDWEKYTGKDGRDYKKQVFVIESVEKNDYGSEFVNRLAFTAHNEQVERLKNFHEGAYVSVDCRVNSREWQGKWYTSVDLFNMQFTHGAAASSTLDNEADDMPF